MLFPVVWLRGMSLDGITYATIARNMALHAGDLWHPFYTATLLNPFYEQPPLALWLQSLLFRLCGDQWWVERVYSALTVVPTSIALVVIWRTLLVDQPQAQRFAWLGLALWVLMPGWFWIYRHNYLENTLGVFTAVAVLASLKAMQPQCRWPAWTLLAALSLVAALGSKGPVGLFPLVTPAIAWLTLGRGNGRQAARVQLLLCGLLIVLGAAVCTSPDARDFLAAYYQRQVVSSLQGQREMVDSGLGRFYLLWALGNHLLPSAAVAAVLVLVGRRCGAGSGREALRPAMFCLATGLSASLPIMLSPKQTGYYAAPSWPYFTLALALGCLPAAVALADRWAAAANIGRVARALRWGGAGLVTLLIVSSPAWYGRTQRDTELIDDVERIGQIVGDHQTIGTPASLRREWSLQAYLYRWHYISLDSTEGTRAFRLEKADRPPVADDRWELADARLRWFRLYRRHSVAAAAASMR